MISGKEAPAGIEVRFNGLSFRVERKRISDIARQVVAFNVGWHNYEQTLSPKDQAEVIDFNLIPRENIAETFYSREHIRSRVLQLMDSLGRIRTGLPEKEYLTASLKASLCYLTGLSGFRIELPQLAKQALGIERLTEFTKEELEKDKREILGILSELGFSGEFTSAMGALQKAHRLTPNEVVEGIKKFGSQFLVAMQEYIGIKAGVEFKIITVFQQNEPWNCWLRSEGDSLALYLNLKEHFYRGDEEHFGLHEHAAHVYQFACWRKAIEDGRLTPASGITKLHTPEQVSIEGVALALPQLVPPGVFRLSQFGELSSRLRTFARKVYHQAHIEINRQPERMEELVSWAEDHLSPYFSREKIQLRLERRLNHPLDRIYELTYIEGLMFHLKAAEAFRRDPHKIRELFQEEYRRPMTVKQLAEWVEERKAA